MGWVKAFMKSMKSDNRYLMRVLLVPAICLGITTSVHADIRICTWNVLRLSSTDASNVTRINALRAVLSEIDPDILVIQEIEGGTAASLFLSNILNGFGGPGGSSGSPEHYTMGSFTSLGSGLDNALYYRDAIFTELTGDFETLNTSPRDTPIWRMRPLSDGSGASDLYVYSMHLKAGSSGADVTDRAAQATAVRNHANDLPAGSHFVFAGDFNIDSSSEPAYVDFIGVQADNDGRAFDPINTPGSWSNNASFAAIHTQSPFSNSPLAPSDATGGGMDDRFDFILISSALQDGSGFDYIANSYTAFGNDGLHFNDDINDAPTIPEGMAIADALVASSDHLPVFLDLAEPVSAPMVTFSPTGVVAFPQTLVGGISEVTYTFNNVASPPGMPLSINIAMLPNGYLSPAGNGPFFATPGNSTNVTIRRDSSTDGFAVGVLQFATNDTAMPSIFSSVNGSVLRHARPSVSDVSEQMSGVASFLVNPDELSQLSVDVFNFGFAQGQSVALEAFDASFDSNPSGRFSTTPFVPVGGITDSVGTALFSFDSNGAAAGDYTATLRLLTRDDSMLSGAINLAGLTYDLTVTVDGPLLGDFDQNDVVDTADIPAMVALLLDPMGASMQDQAIGDMNQDTVNDGADIAGFVDALLN